MAGMQKTDKEQDGMIFVGKGKKNKGKNKTEKVVPASEAYQYPLNLDIDVVQRFSLVNVGPPNYPNELDAKIEQLQKRKEELTEKGKEMFDEKIAKKEQEILDVAAEFDDAAALKKQAAKEEGPSRRGRGSRGGYGGSREGQGRGARGRGGRGGRGDARGGAMGMSSREDESLRTHEANSEFEAFDDDSIYKKEPVPVTSGQNKTQKSFAFNANDFEAL